MKKFLAENWFKVGILVLIAAGIIIFIIILKTNSGNAVLVQEQIAPQPTQVIQPTQSSSTINSTSSTLENNSTIAPSPTPTAEDPTLKIAICKSDAQIESNLDMSRYNDPVDLMACLSNVQCNFSNLSSLLKDQQKSLGETSYDNFYNACLQLTQSQYNSFVQEYNSDWNECISQNPEPTDNDASGAEGMNTYNAREECVTNLEKTATQ